MFTKNSEKENALFEHNLLSILFMEIVAIVCRDCSPFFLLTL